MKGYILRVKSGLGSKAVKVTYYLYGRIINKLYRGKRKYYYTKGMLHNTLFCRLGKGKLFVEDIASIDFDLIKTLEGNIIVEDAELNDDEYEFRTGKDYWLNKYVNEKGVKVYVSKENR